MANDTKGFEPPKVAEDSAYVSILTEQRVVYHKQSRFNPIRSLSPELLSRQLDDFQAGLIRYFALTMEAIQERDDTLKTVIPKRRSAMKRRKWQVMVDPNADPKEGEAHKKVLEYFYQNVEATHALDRNKRGGFPMLVEQMMDAHAKKYSAHEILWRPDADGLRAIFNFVPLQFFENLSGKLRFLQQDFDTAGQELEPSNWLICVGEGLMEACAVAYMFKHIPLKDWLLYCEKHGMPGIHGKTEHPYNSAAWNALKEAVSQIAADFSCVTGATDVIEKLDFSADGELPYPKIIDKMDRAMVQMWRGGDLGTMSHGATQGGEGTGASLQGDEAFKLESGDADWISEHLQINVDRRVIAYHFGEGTKPLAWVKVVVPEIKDSTKDIAIDTFLVTNGAPLSVRETMERYDRSMPEDGEDLLEAPKPEPAFGGGAAPGDRGGKPAQNRKRTSFAANEALDTTDSEEVTRAANRRVLDKGFQRLAANQASALQPLRERIEALLEMPNEEAFLAGVTKLREDLPDLLRVINNTPENARAIEQVMTAFFFNGVAHGVVRQHAATRQLANSQDSAGNCGTGSGGFQPGNKCAGGGTTDKTALTLKGDASFPNPTHLDHGGSSSKGWLLLKHGEAPEPEVLSPESARIDHTSGISRVNGLRFEQIERMDYHAIPNRHLAGDENWIEADKKKGQHPASGAVIMEPDGRLWLVEPKNGYGGYRNTIPKGTLEKGLTAQQNAHKEIHEETGLQVRLEGVLGDFKGDTSTTRYYLAKRIGGDPRTHRRDETAAVKLVTMADARKILNRSRDHRVLDALEAHLTGELANDKNGTGQPCGDSWISGEKVCRVGKGSAADQEKQYNDFKEKVQELSIKVHAEPENAEAKAKLGVLFDQHPKEWADSLFGGKTPEFNGDAAALPNPAGDGKSNEPMPKTETQSTAKLPATEHPTGHWPAHNSAAQWGAKKIALMEQLFKDGKFAELKAMDTVPKSAKPHSYSKAVHEVHNQLIAKVEKGAVPEAVKLPPAPTVEAKAPEAKSGPKGFPSNPHDTSTWTKTSGNLGSNPGGKYVDPTGQAWYVKEQKSEDHARNEMLAAKLYAITDAPVVHSDAAIVNGKYGTATKWKEGESFMSGSIPQKQSAQEHFATHAWLGNWDAVGASFDNQKLMGGKMTTVDVGGSMLFRAQGAAKGPDEWNKHVNEWDNMRNPAVAPQAAAVFKSMTPEQLISSGKKVAAVSDTAIDLLVSAYGPKNEGAKQALGDMLKARRDTIAGKVAEMEKQLAAKAVPAPTPEVKPEPKNEIVPKNEAAPGPKVPAMIPSPPIVTSIANLSAQKKFNDLHNAALTGDIDKVHAVPTKADAKQTYAKQHHKYKQALISALTGDADSLAAHGYGMGSKPAAFVAEKPMPAKPGQTKKSPAELMKGIEPPAAPDFISKNAANVTANKAAHAQMLDLFQKGDLAGLKKMAGNFPPSPKLQQWHSSAIATLDEALNPPAPPEPAPPEPAKQYQGHVEKIHDAHPVITNGKDHAEKIASYLVLGNPGVPMQAPAGKWLNHDKPSEFAGHKSIYEKLPGQQQSAISSYLGGGYGAMTSNLIANMHFGTELSQKNKDFVAGFFKAAQPVAEGVKLKRYVTLDEKAVEQLKNGVGKVIEDPAGVSWSINQNWLWHGNVELHATTVKGVKGLYAANAGNGAIGSSHEYELMMLPNNRFVITGWDNKVTPGSSAKIRVHGYMLPTVEAQKPK